MYRRMKPLEPSNLWIRICQGIMYPLTRLVGRREYVGMEKLHRPGPVLLVGNHVSHLDPVYDTVLVHKAGRIPHVLAKAGLWKIPVVGHALVKTGQIPVERGGTGAGDALETATRTLQDSGLVLIYPEGTVTKQPEFWPMRPRPGVAKLALSTDARVVPIVHWGTQKVYNSYATDGKRKLRLWPRQTVRVIVGDDIDLTELRAGGSDARSILAASNLIMGRITDMLAAERGESAPATLFDPKKAEREAGSGDGAKETR